MTNEINELRIEIRNGFEQINSRIDGLEDKVSKLDSKVSKLDDRVSKLDDRVSKLDDRVSKLDDQVHSQGLKLEFQSQRIDIALEHLIALRKKSGDYENHDLEIKSTKSDLDVTKAVLSKHIKNKKIHKSA